MIHPFDWSDGSRHEMLTRARHRKQAIVRHENVVWIQPQSGMIVARRWRWHHHWKCPLWIWRIPSWRKATHIRITMNQPGICSCRKSCHRMILRVDGSVWTMLAVGMDSTRVDETGQESLVAGTHSTSFSTRETNSVAGSRLEHPCRQTMDMIHIDMYGGITCVYILFKVHHNPWRQPSLTFSRFETQRIQSCQQRRGHPIPFQRHSVFHPTKECQRCKWRIGNRCCNKMILTCEWMPARWIQVYSNNFPRAYNNLQTPAALHRTSLTWYWVQHSPWTKFPFPHVSNQSSHRQTSHRRCSCRLYRCDW